ncbi:ABC transporter ATP-binding protein [Parabacteroides sp. OttesenSCG-928-G07]|nr:ABC transporter ATP-binding protein [Parabacteroides sp. OttesenSCG-928-G07]
MNNVRVEHISKSYGNVKALQDISLDILPGELFGLIGPDGTGKTTLFRIMTTLLSPDKGDVTVCGYDIKKDLHHIRSIVGYMPGRFSLYQDLTVYENLRFFATVFNTTIEENYETIREIYVQIEPFRNRRAGKLSGGMKQKLALCCALIHRPEVLFLDEPTTGVDPVSRIEFWDMLARLKEKGITIIVSTPYMDEASRCDRIALMRDGICLQMGTPEYIRRSFDKPLWAIDGENIYKLLTDLRSSDMVYSCFSFGDTLHLTVKPEITQHKDPETIQKEINVFLEKKGHKQIRMTRIEPGIEDCFMALQQPV